MAAIGKGEDDVVLVRDVGGLIIVRISGREVATGG